MRIVIALAESALHRRGEKGCSEDEAHHVRAAAAQLARVADGNDLVIVHDNEHHNGHHRSAVPASRDRAPFHNGEIERDVFDAETNVGVGCRFELELRNCLTSARPCATLLTMVEVDRADPAFEHPDKAIGAFIVDERALAAAHAKHWSLTHDGIGYRRVVPNPRPKRLLQTQPLHRLIEQGTVVMCSGGGMPVVAAADGALQGVQAFIDPYGGAALIAETIDADLFVIATDMAGVILDCGTANSKLLRHGHPSAVREFALSAGAMAPKLHAASRFAERTGRRAAIGALADVERLVDGTAGTTISCERVDPSSILGGSVAR
ncbi:carbamate kinase [Trinickia dinghuensis]|uniref:Carbamate kinase n=1 Tax=Trinickia dinghuensis TaxID=2291023 RepID=A0A3D8K2T4_9BURK|nr:carbamate kinase [Trinickia dinghuensis]RDU99164.1 carbamate kinase [Trinickia dinghuensis]